MILLLKDRILRLTIIHSSLLLLIFSTRNYFRPPSRNSMQAKQWYFGFSRDSMAIYPGIELIAKTTISSRKYGKMKKEPGFVQRGAMHAGRRTHGHATRQKNW